MTQIDYVVCFTHLTLLSHGWWKIQYALFSFSIYFYFPLCTPLTWQRRTQFKVVAQIAREANRVRRFAHSFLIWPQTLVDDFFISSSFHFEFFRVSITSAFMQWIFNLLHYFLSLYRDEIELLDSPNCDIWGICGDKRKWIWFCTMEKLSMDPKKVFLEIFSMEKNRGEKGKVEIWFFIITVSRIQFDLQLDSSLYTII